MALLRITMTVDDDGNYDKLMDDLMFLGAYDIEEEEIEEEPKRPLGGPKKGVGQ